ncbi:MAG TPA: hypothetical protein VL400_22185 [Polyangiaceae bacterium]|nr:hypothetical protein [Polyangiaceae bacterium]
MLPRDGRQATLPLLGAGIAIAMFSAACEGAPLDELLAGKACTDAGECATGYVCEETSRTCVPEGATSGGGGSGGTGTTSTSSTGGSGGSGGCDSVTDCPTPSSACEVPICVGGVCGTSALPMGTVTAAQTSGDCKVAVCDGAGAALDQNDPTDLPPTGQCATPICNSGVPETRAVTIGTACSRNGGSFCDAAGSCVECNGESDCSSLPPTTECGTRMCVGGACSLSPTQSGTPVLAQSPGDCNQAVCDGAGGVTSMADDLDVPDDFNECTTDGCSAGTPTHVPVSSGLPCAAGSCNASGQCVGCTVAADCGTSTFCAQRTCTSGVCGFSNTSAGTPLPSTSQTPADCQELQCNGTGGVISVAAQSDIPVDDGVACTGETCVSGSPQHPPLPTGSSCNQNGGIVCDGSGDCVQCNAASDCASTGTICQSATCLQNTCGLANDASGTLAPAAAQTSGDCKDLVCDGAGGTTTQADPGDLPIDGDDCTLDLCTGGTPSNPPSPAGTPCGNGGTCDGAGTCSAKHGNGSGCTADTECASGHCPAQDGICCASSCVGTCESCDAAKTGGTSGICSSIPSQEDPDLECMTSNATCNGAGQCAFVCGQTPTPPPLACPAECTGGCSGGTCVIACGTGNACQGANLVCPSGFACEVQCAGSGACGNATITCSDFYACDVVCSGGACSGLDVGCGTGACALDCTGNATCTGAAVTCGANACHATCNSAASSPQVACGSSCDCATCGKPLGATCTTGTQCASGFCPTLDGVCCNEACSGLCRACTSSATGQATGTCAPILNGLDPNNECAGPKTCNGAQACSN